MMRGIQFRRNNLGVTPVEYVLIGYFFCIFVVVGAKVIGSSLNTNFSSSQLTPLSNDVSAAAPRALAPRGGAAMVRSSLPVASAVAVANAADNLSVTSRPMALFMLID